ncbi:RNA-directed DNA polymerase (Reverse transcriptase), partial [Trifolium medium]|nr:RNA-directed DNA polymerase (Reverse transcriptase) [Trifolium medium]
MGFVLKEKLKRLKGALKKWNKDVYGSVDTKIGDLTDAIECLELKGEREGLSEEELVERKTKFNNLWLLLKSKDSLEFQKSRSRRLREGDANTEFFHACVKSRRRSNSLVALKKGSEWLSTPEAIR